MVISAMQMLFLFLAKFMDHILYGFWILYGI